MRQIAYLAATLFAVLFSSLAFAADLPSAITLPTKAPSYLQYPAGSGWFYGVSASGLGGSAAASNAGGGTVIGGRFGIDGGYTGLIGNTFYFIEVSASVQAMSGTGNALNVISSANFEERFAVGVPDNIWQQALALIPGLSGTAMPSLAVSGATVSVYKPYVFGALYQDDVSATIGADVGKAWLLSYGAGVGGISYLTNGMAVDTSIEWKHQANGMLVGTSLVYPFQDAYLATVRLKF